jgi:arylsulfatase A-like enzyme
MTRTSTRNTYIRPVFVLLLAGLFLFPFFVIAQNKISAIPASGTPARPNILIIMTDQQSAAMLSTAGNKWLHTPAMDRLAAAGVRFEKAYVTNPVCLPSRFSIQTGMLPSVAGIRANGIIFSSENRSVIQSLYSRSLGSTFRNAGYDTYYGGKLHVPLENRNPALWGYTEITKNDREGLANDVSGFLLNRKAVDKPFLLFASFINPHDICFDAIRFGSPESEDAKATPPDFFDVKKMAAGINKTTFFEKYCPPLPDNHQPMIGESYTVDSLIRLRDFRKAVRDRWTDEDWRLHRWVYARLVERVDSLIGQVLAALDRSGVKENTIVVFTSDHGENDGSHKLEHKTVFFEESARIPFVISYPWLSRKGEVDSSHIVSNGLDLFPTLCELAKIQPPSGLPGRSLLPLLSKAPVKNWREHIIIENELGYLIHTGRYKYELDDKNGDNIREVFSDLQVDPGEKYNMIQDRKYASRIAGLRTALLAHLEKSNIQITPPDSKSNR